MVAGISGCSALLVTGFGVRDSVTGIVTQQYTQIQTYDIGVTYSSSVTPEQKSELESKEQDGVEKSVIASATRRFFIFSATLSVCGRKEHGFSWQ